MPTAGTHITVVEQLLISHPQLRTVLGDPDPLGDDPAIRYAKLGAIGPDLFYTLLDTMPGLQDLIDFLVKFAGTVSCISDVVENINNLIVAEVDAAFAGVGGEIERSCDLLKAAVVDGLLALVVDSGINLYGVFGASPRQEGGHPPKEWPWADWLHYYHTGDFTNYLLEAARKTGDKNLIAYALGYLTHYVADVVGHAYVNQVVQSPYRLHHQRHHLVENFIDAYVWNRYHNVTASAPGAALPLDTPTGAHATDGGAAAIGARLHEHIDIGSAALAGQIDNLIRHACREISSGTLKAGTWIGLRYRLEFDPPEDHSNWCEFMARTMSEYCARMKQLKQAEAVPHEFETPQGLAGSKGRPDGYPHKDDVAAAYAVLRLFLKIQTEEMVEPPRFPDIVGDITHVIEDTMRDIVADIGGIPPAPTPHHGKKFSLDHLLDDLAAIVRWAGEVLVHLARALADLVRGLAGLVTTAAADAVKVLLWMVNSVLYALYRNFRDILVVNGYVMPLTEQVAAHIGPLDCSGLWVSRGDLASTGVYPVAEYCLDEDHSDRGLLNSYRPYIEPAASQPGQVEAPALASSAPFVAGDRPEKFLEAGPGPDDMFFQVPAAWSSPETGRLDFGGVIANSYKAITCFIGGQPLALPNYDLDSDRGYGWLNWRPFDGQWETLDPQRNTARPIQVHAELVR
jgi:hypothetical protein